MTKKAASPHRVAVVQHPPVTLHRQKTLERGVGLLEEAAAGGARLVSFPETWLPGYPEWIWRLRPAEDYALTGEIHGLLIENAVDLKAGDLKPIQTAARKLKVTVSIGIHERDGVVASAAKRTLGVAGHYGRPDIFKLEVNREILAPIDFG
jgi:nitrilase